MRTQSLRELPAEFNPRSRINALGADSLSAPELLAIVLDRGNPTMGPLDRAYLMMMEHGGLYELARADIPALVSQWGMTEIQAVRVKAALALGQRSQNEKSERVHLGSTGDAKTYLQNMQFLQREEMHVIMLTVKNRVIRRVCVYAGSVHTTVVRIGEVMRPAILDNAYGIILAHNHPSGDPTPSPEDASVTRDIGRMASTLDIDLVDHIVVGNGRSVSMKEMGLGFN